MKEAGKGHELLSDNLLSGVHGGRADDSVEETETVLCLDCGWTSNSNQGNVMDLWQQHSQETGHEKYMVSACRPA